MKYLLIKYDEIKADSVLSSMLDDLQHYDVVLTEEETDNVFKDTYKEAYLLGCESYDYEVDYFYDKFKTKL